MPSAELLEVDPTSERILERFGRIVGGLVDAVREGRTPDRVGIGREKAGDTGHQGRHVGQRIAEDRCRPELVERMALAHSLPEFAQALHPLVRFVARDDCAFYGADRRANHPVGLDAAFHERLIDAGLVGAECAAALQHQHHLLLDESLLGARCL
jgi:hypothetical protein